MLVSHVRRILTNEIPGEKREDWKMELGTLTTKRQRKM